MNKKKKLILTLIISVVAIGSILGGAAVAFAEDEEEDQSQSYLDRVAEIYEANTGTSIDVEQLETAMQQAGEDIRSEARDSMFDKLVEDGILTQEEADEYQAWLDARPDIDINLPNIERQFGRIFRHMDERFERGNGFTSRFPCFVRSDNADTE